MTRDMRRLVALLRLCELLLLPVASLLPTLTNPLLQGRVGSLRVSTRRFQRAHAVGHVGGCARRAVLQRAAA